MYKFDMTKFSSICISRFYSKLSRSHSIFYRIRGVMVSVLTSSVVDREFELRSGQAKDYIKLLVAASPADWLDRKHVNVPVWTDISVASPAQQTG